MMGRGGFVRSLSRITVTTVRNTGKTGGIYFPGAEVLHREYFECTNLKVQSYRERKG